MHACRVATDGIVESDEKPRAHYGQSQSRAGLAHFKFVTFLHAVTTGRNGDIRAALLRTSDGCVSAVVDVQDAHIGAIQKLEGRGHTCANDSEQRCAPWSSWHIRQCFGRAIPIIAFWVPPYLSTGLWTAF